MIERAGFNYFFIIQGRDGLLFACFAVSFFFFMIFMVYFFPLRPLLFPSVLCGYLLNTVQHRPSQRKRFGCMLTFKYSIYSFSVFFSLCNLWLISLHKVSDISNTVYEISNTLTGMFMKGNTPPVNSLRRSLCFIVMYLTVWLWHHQ
jgi:hypothetical protein